VTAIAVRAATPLELLHPAGKVDRMLVLGDRCPPSLLPPGARREQTEADLALIAPSRAQLRERGWLARAVGEATAALAADGLVCVLVPRGHRAAARERLRSAGLLVDQPVAVLPGQGPPRYLVPLDARVWTHALRHLIDARPRIRAALVALRALPFGQRLLAAALPAVGIIARPSGGAPPDAWVSALAGQTRPGARLVLAAGWRWPLGPVVAYCFAANERAPWGIVKVGPDCAREARTLAQLGASAEAAGVRVPGLLATGTVGDRPALAETVVSGEPAARLLDRSPERFEDVAGALAGWLERWHDATARRTRVSASLLERELMDPLAAVGAELAGGAGYRESLATRCAALAGTEIALVATHDDVTMWNVLLERDGALGLIDWAEARDSGLALTDFFYAIVDAAAACDGYRDRLGALRACFERGGARAGVAGALRERLRTSLGLSADAVELSFHACWLRHAANELRTGRSSDGPFLEIVRWLAR
jgi:hypothetical protein